MKLADEKRFEGTPQVARTQVCLVICDQHHLGGIATVEDLVGTALGEDAILNTQTLANDFELEKMRWFNRCDALYQIAPPVSAAHHCT